MANPNPNPNPDHEDSVDEPSGSSTRTPFSDLSQVDADLALALILQEQEHIFALLSLNDNNDDDNDDFHDHLDEENDGGDNDDDGIVYPSDEAYSAALQEAEELALAAQPSAIYDHDDDDGHGYYDDGDDLTYEELLALGDVVGTVSRGVSADDIAALTSVNYKAETATSGDMCVICHVEYDDGEKLTSLPCKHCYHSECINGWLNINKVCPVCNAEVTNGVNAQTEIN